MYEPNKYIFLGRKMKEISGQLKVSEWETLFYILVFSTPGGVTGVETKEGNVRPGTIKELCSFWGVNDKTAFLHLNHFVELGLLEKIKGPRNTKLYRTTHDFFTFSENDVTHESIPVDRNELYTLYKNIRPHIWWKDDNGIDRKLYPFSYLLVSLIHKHRQLGIICDRFDVPLRTVEREGKTFFDLEWFEEIEPFKKMKFWSLVSGKSYTMSTNQKEIFYNSLNLLEEQGALEYVDAKLKYYFISSQFFTYSR